MVVRLGGGIVQSETVAWVGMEPRAAPHADDFDCDVFAIHMEKNDKVVGAQGALWTGIH